MCDIFPVFENFCACINLRIGMLMIAILAIVTGGLTMSISEQVTKTCFNEMMNVTGIRDATAIMSNTGKIIRCGITAIALVFMFTGVVLLLGTLTDQEGLVQVFVWATFVNVLFGFILILSVSYDCITKSTCLLDGVDWLSGATGLVACFFYLISWIYFISVANSYVVLVIT